jgi:hypothetical protein
MSKIYALLIDDDIKWSQSIIIEALEAYNIELHHAQNLEEMKVFLTKYPNRYSTILLDIIGFKEKNQASADQSFIAAALKFLDHSYPALPRIIVTGEKGVWDSAREFWQDEIVFQKEDDDLTKMFKLIKENSRNYIVYKLKNKYKDIFSIFEMQYPNRDVQEKLKLIEQSLLELLRKNNEGHFVTIKRNLSTVRTIQETVFQCLYKIDNRLLSRVPFDKRGNIIFDELNNHHNNHKIEGNEICPGVINCLRLPIYVLSSNHGSHVPFEDSSYPPTKYTVQALTFALLDFLKWFGIILTKYNKES